MPYLTDLPEAARKSGLRVIEVAGWRTRGHGPMRDVQGILIHHTGTPRTHPGDYPSLRVVRDGRKGLAGPLAQLGLGRDGTVYVIAAGLCYHAGATYKTWQGNSHAIGIEAEGDGKTPFNDVQAQAYVALVAALVDHYGIGPDRVESHRMAAKPHFRKPDPFGVDPAEFRGQVARALHGGITASLTLPPKDPTFGHRGIPAPLNEDGVWGPRTVDALLWYVNGDRLVGLTRDNVRDVQSWLGRDRTGRLTRDDVKALQAKTGSDPDGIWPNKVGQKSNTTAALQRWLNKRAAEARAKENA